MTRTQCLTNYELKAWTLGRLDDRMSEQIADHISSCEQCEETVSGFDATSDSLVGNVRVAATTRDPDREDQLASGVLSALEQIPNPWLTQGTASTSDRVQEFLRDYELLEPLGSGGMGTVYRAVHMKLQRTVALKLLPSRRLRDKGAIDRFEREMRAIGRLNHPAIVRATDAGEVDGTHFLAMDFVQGIDLSQLVRTIGSMSVANASEVIRQSALGLQYAHDQGLIHRDIKPSNLMLEVSPGSPSQQATATVKILDLGLALFGSASESIDDLTTVGQLMGTLDYMAPEQADNSHQVDARADVYSLGATMFKLLTGSAPYETDTYKSPLKKMKALATVDVPGVKHRAEAIGTVTIPEEVAAIVDRMLLRDPTSRFATAAEVATVLAPFCEGHTLAFVAEEGLSLWQQRRMQEAQNARQWADAMSPNVKLPDQSVASVPAPVATRAAEPASELRLLNTPRQHSRRTGNRWVIGAVLLTALLLSATTFYLKTNNGILKIECVDDGVPIEIRQGETTVRELTMKAGQNEITLRVGQYQVIVPAKYDQLIVENGVFEISRGGLTIAKITHDSTSRNTENDSARRALDAEQVTVDSQKTSEALAGLKLPVLQDATDPIQAVTLKHLLARYAEVLRTIDISEFELSQAATQYGPAHPTTLRLTEKLQRNQETEAVIRTAIAKLQDQISQSSTNRTDASIPMAKSDPMSTERSEKLFEGKTFDQWASILSIETSPGELEKAVMALCIMARGVREEEAARLVFDVVRIYPCDVGIDTAEEKLVASAIRYLRGLRPEKIEPAIIDEITANIDHGPEFLFEGLLDSNAGRRGSLNEKHVDLGSAESLQEQLRNSTNFRTTIVRQYLNLSANTRDGAMEWLPEYDDVPDLNGQLVDIWKTMQVSRMVNERQYAAMRLPYVQPMASHADLLVPLVSRHYGYATSSSDVKVIELTMDSVRALNALYTLKTELRPAIPKIIALQNWKSQQTAEHRGRDVSILTIPAEHPTGSVVVQEIFASAWLFQLELMSLADPTDEEALEFVRQEIQRRTTSVLDDEGRFRIRPVRQQLVLEMMPRDARDVSVKAWGYQPFTLPNQELEKNLPNAFTERLVSALIAYERLTGSPARFAVNPLQNSRSGDVVSLLDGRSLEELIQQISADVEHATFPQLADAASLMPQVVDTDPNADQVRKWTQLILKTFILKDAHRDASESNVSSADATAHDELIGLYLSNQDREATLFLQLFDEGDLKTQHWLLSSWAAGDTTFCDNEAFPNGIQNQFRSGPGAAARYERLITHWNTIPSEMQSVLIRLEFQFRELKNAASGILLEQCLSDASNTNRIEAAQALAGMTDLSPELKSRVRDILIAAIENDASPQLAINTIPLLMLVASDQNGSIKNDVLERLQKLLLNDLQAESGKDIPAAEFSLGASRNVPSQIVRSAFATFRQETIIVSRRILLMAFLPRVSDGTSPDWQAIENTLSRMERRTGESSMPRELVRNRTASYGLLYVLGSLHLHFFVAGESVESLLEQQALDIAAGDVPAEQESEKAVAP